MREDLLPKTNEEKIAYLIEECGEVLKAIGKYQRFGPTAVDPVTGIEYNNVSDLLIEMQDLERAIGFVRAELEED